MSEQKQRFIKYFKMSLHNLIGNATKVYNLVLQYCNTDKCINKPFLFYGSPGTGKSEAGKRIAGIITDYTIENVIHLSGSTLSIEYLKNLIDTLHYVSLFGNGRKCLIIEEIDQMSASAQNLLLHVIDTIQDHVLIIATSNYFDKLQDRLQSRFFAFEFLPAKNEDISDLLQNITHIPANVANSIANGCTGDIRQAINDSIHAKMIIDAAEVA